MGGGKFYRMMSRVQVPEIMMNMEKDIMDNWDFAKPLCLEFKPETRSLQANRYLWGWLYHQIEKQLCDAGITIPAESTDPCKAGREYPYTKDILHAMFKDNFLCYDEIRVKTRTRKLCWSTKDLTRKTKDDGFGERPSFSWYVTQIKQFCSQYWHIEIADPPPQVCDYPEILKEINCHEEVR